MNDITLDTCLPGVTALLDVLVVTKDPVYLQRRLVIFRTEQNKVANIEQNSSFSSSTKLGDKNQNYPEETKKENKLK